MLPLQPLTSEEKPKNKKTLFLMFPTLVAQLVKNPPAMRETWIRSLGLEDPLEKGKATTPVFWPGEFHGLYNPWGPESWTQSNDFHFHGPTILHPGE